MLRIQHLTKHYPGSDKGVTDLSLHVRPGDLYAFIGHNGAGKTTALKAVAGIHTFDEGEILIEGPDIRNDPLTCKGRMAGPMVSLGACGVLCLVPASLREVAVLAVSAVFLGGAWLLCRRARRVRMETL